MKTIKYGVGDRVRCYRESPEGATGTIVKINTGNTSPYKIRWDATNNESWVSRAVVFGKVD